MEKDRAGVYIIPGKKISFKFEQFQSLLLHDRVADFMSTPPITLKKDAKMSYAKKLMRQYRISGIPIVDDEGMLIGLISLENIIIALEKDNIDDPIKHHMIEDVIVLHEDMEVSKVIELFMSYSYGRYPVVDHDYKVVGVITNGDLMLHILERLGNVYLHDKRRDEMLGTSKYLLTPEIYNADQCFTYTIDSTDLDRAGEGSSLFKKHLQKHALPTDIIRRASIAMYEAEVNVVLHAEGRGYIRAYILEGQLYMMITDDGPGIDNVELAMQPGYTTASDDVRERGFGAGMGLSNIERYTDKLVILSSDNGLKMEMVIVIEKTNDNDQV